MTVGELRRWLNTLPLDSDDWTVALEDSAGCVYGVAEQYADVEKRGVWLVGEANGVGGDHW